MSRQLVTILLVAVMMAAGFYYLRTTSTVKNRYEAVDVIMRNTKIAVPGTLTVFSDEFVTAWANAILQGRPSFELNGKYYSSYTGNAVS